MNRVQSVWVTRSHFAWLSYIYFQRLLLRAMNDNQPSKTRNLTPSLDLVLNILAACRTGGPIDSAGRPGKLRIADLMRSTGMSRTTISPLMDKDAVTCRNPDLATLHKIAQALGIPLAFLLMTPRDWVVLQKAARLMIPEGEFMEAAKQVVGDTMSSAEKAVAVLERCKVHPDRRPIGQSNEREQRSLDVRNERRRRASIVMCALTLRGGQVSIAAEMTALAAILGNLLTNSESKLDNDFQN
jgi:transcriptional regulator with XRE-family HTH domain